MAWNHSVDTTNLELERDGFEPQWGPGGPGTGKVWSQVRTQRLYEDAAARQQRLEAHREFVTKLEAPFKPTLHRSPSQNGEAESLSLASPVSPASPDEQKPRKPKASVFDRLAVPKRVRQRTTQARSFSSIGFGSSVRDPIRIKYASRRSSGASPSAKKQTSSTPRKSTPKTPPVAERLYRSGVDRLQRSKDEKPLSPEYTFRPKILATTYQNKAIRAAVSFVQRLYNPAALIEKDARRRACEVERTKRLTFRPRLMTRRSHSPPGLTPAVGLDSPESPSSLASPNSDKDLVSERLYRIAAEKKKRRQEQIQEHEAKQLEACTFSPILATRSLKGRRARAQVGGAAAPVYE